MKAATFALVIAFMVMTIVAGGNFLWMLDWGYMINISIGIVILYGLAYVFGKKAGYEILIKRKNSRVVGAKYAVLILLLIAFLVGWTGFVQEGMEPSDTFWDSFEDYIFKPFFWILFVGILPALLVGILFGRWIKTSNPNKG